VGHISVTLMSGHAYSASACRALGETQATKGGEPLQPLTVGCCNLGRSMYLRTAVDAFSSLQLCCTCAGHQWRVGAGGLAPGICHAGSHALHCQQEAGTGPG
jgi:hypothetical protein